MSGETTLLPCPFREHNRKRLVIHHRKCRWHEGGLYAVKCEICGIRGPYALSEEKAIEKWNTRHVETCRITASSTDGLCSDNPRHYFELSCGHSFTINGLDAPVACAVCGKVVKNAD